MNQMRLLHFVLIATLSTTFFLTVPAFAETTGSIAVTLTYTNGDTADYWPVSLKIYQDFDKTPYKEIVSLSANPFNIVSLPTGHKYKIEAYANSMYSSVSYVDLEQSHQDATINLPLPGGMRVNVFYNDGLTPISNATVYVRSQDNKTWGHGPVDVDGKSMRFWIAPTTLENDHYIVDVKIGDDLTYSQSPVLLTPGIPQERKIVTNWPPVINTLITTNVLDAQLHHVTLLNGKFIVRLYDINGNKIDESQVTSHGEAHFSNLKVGDYLFKAVNAKDGSEWGTSKTTLDGSKFSFDIVEKQVVPVPQSSPPPTQLIPQPVPQTIQPTPQPIPQNTQPAPKQVCNCVAFRLDNIQDYWLSNVQIQVIDTFVQKNASLTIGVIGKAFGEDSKLTDHIKSKIQTGKIDVGTNGWGFEDFTTSTKSEQTQLLQESKDKISTVLGVSPSVFIPPYGKANNDTFYAMIDSGVFIISGNSDIITPPSLEGKISNYHPTTYIGLVQDHNSNQSMTNDKIISDIHNNIQTNGYAIVSINFQDYAQNNGTVKLNIPDSEKIQNLQSLIDDIRNNGYQIVTIKDISNTSNVPEFGPFATIMLMLSVIMVITILSRSNFIKL